MHPDLTKTYTLGPAVIDGPDRLLTGQQMIDAGWRHMGICDECGDMHLLGNYSVGQLCDTCIDEHEAESE